MGRNINVGSDSAGVSLFVKLLIVAVIVYGIYYVVNKTDFVKNIKEKSEKTIEEITDCKFSDIKYINTDKEKNISIEEFSNKYKDKKYKNETDMIKLSEDGDVTYYVYSQDDKYEFKLFDLGDGYIKIVKESATLYKEVE